jgi:hypothetical protein
LDCGNLRAFGFSKDAEFESFERILSEGFVDLLGEALSVSMDVQRLSFSSASWVGRPSGAIALGFCLALAKPTYPAAFAVVDPQASWMGAASHPSPSITAAKILLR